MQKRKLLNSPRLSELKKKKRRIFLGKILLGLLALVVFFGVLAYLARVPNFNISSVEVSGTKILDAETVKTVVKQEAVGYYLWFFPKSNFLLFPKNKVENELTSRFKRLKSVSFNFKNLGTLAVSLSEREGKYVWCGEDLPAAEQKAEEYLCHFMDETGYIFDEAPHFSGEVYFKFFGPVLESYFSPDVFEQIVTFNNFLSSMEIKPVAVYLKKDGDAEIYLSSSGTNVAKIVFKKDFDLEKLSENLRAAFSTEPLQSDFKNKYSSLLYIDLRFGNKVYYKFK